MENISCYIPESIYLFRRRKKVFTITKFKGTNDLVSTIIKPGYGSNICRMDIPEIFESIGLSLYDSKYLVAILTMIAKYAYLNSKPSFFEIIVGTNIPELRSNSEAETIINKFFQFLISNYTNNTRYKNVFPSKLPISYTYLTTVQSGSIRLDPSTQLLSSVTPITIPVAIDLLPLDDPRYQKLSKSIKKSIQNIEEDKSNDNIQIETNSTYSWFLHEYLLNAANLYKNINSKHVGYIQPNQINPIIEELRNISPSSRDLPDLKLMNKCMFESLGLYAQETSASEIVRHSLFDTDIYPSSSSFTPLGSSENDSNVPLVESFPGTDIGPEQLLCQRSVRNCKYAELLAKSEMLSRHRSATPINPVRGGPQPTTATASSLSEYPPSKVVCRDSKTLLQMADVFGVHPRYPPSPSPSLADDIESVFPIAASIRSIGRDSLDVDGPSAELLEYIRVAAGLKAQGGNWSHLVDANTSTTTTTSVTTESVNDSGEGMFDASALVAVAVIVEELARDMMCSWRDRVLHTANESSPSSTTTTSNHSSNRRRQTSSSCNSTSALEGKLGVIPFSLQALRVEAALQVQGATICANLEAVLTNRLEVLFGMKLSSSEHIKIIKECISEEMKRIHEYAIKKDSYSYHTAAKSFSVSAREGSRFLTRPEMSSLPKYLEYKYTFKTKKSTVVRGNKRKRKSMNNGDESGDNLVVLGIAPKHACPE
eukprot:gene7284-14860_t